MRYINLVLIYFVVLSCSTTSHKYNDNLFVLFTPLNLAFKDKYEINLIDQNKKLINQWRIDYPGFNPKIEDDGLLYHLGFEQNIKIEGNHLISHPNFTILNKKNDIVWSYYNKNIHHDFARINDEQIAFIAFDKRNNIIYEKIIIVDRTTNKTIWSWSIANHEKVEPNNIKKYHGDIYHFNSIQYLKRNWINNNPAFLVSARHTHTIYLIDKIERKVIWQSKKGLTHLQHDARYKDGLISVFDNGHKISSVVFIDPKTQKIVKSLDGGPTRLDKISFYSSITSGAVPYKDKYLITLGVPGLITLIDKDNNVIWRHFEQTKEESQSRVWPYELLFRAQPYDADILNKLN